MGTPETWQNQMYLVGYRLSCAAPFPSVYECHPPPSLRSIFDAPPVSLHFHTMAGGQDRSTFSTSSSTWLVKGVQTLPGDGHFPVLQTWLLGVETREGKGRAVPRQEGISITWSPCHEGCECIKAVGTREGNHAREKNTGRGFHLTFSVSHLYLLSSTPRSLVHKDTGQDKIRISHN